MVVLAKRQVTNISMPGVWECKRGRRMLRTDVEIWKPGYSVHRLPLYSVLCGSTYMHKVHSKVSDIAAGGVVALTLVPCRFWLLTAVDVLELPLEVFSLLRL